MAKGSQLSQLKSRLSSAGLNRQSQPGGNNRDSAKAKEAAKKRKRGPDDEKKLEKIRKEMNPFEEKTTRLKHDVGGRKLKGSSGRPGQAKQAGLEERKRTLLPALSERHHTGTFVDRRFGESNPTLTPEEKMLERFTKEKQRASVRGSSRADLFNLGDSGDEGEGLTHYGKSLGIDDFEGEGLGIGLEEDDEEDRGQIDRDTVRHAHFGGFDEEDEDRPERKKSKSEVMAEVMAKSKDHKYARQLEREKDDQLRQNIDDEFGDLRDLLMGVPLTETEAKFNPEDPSLTASSANRVPVGPRPEGRAAFTVPETNETSAVPDPNAAPEPVDYDQFVKSLAFDRRAKPTDRTKTEEEIALEEKEKLEEAEKKRLRRMRGEPDSDEEDEGAGGKGKKRKAKVDENRKRGADDLEDDFDMEEGEMGMEGAYGLGGGLGDAGPEGEDEDEEMEDGDEEDGSEGEDDEEGTGEEESDDMEDLDDSEAGEAQPEDGDDEEDVSTLPTDTSLLIPSATKSIAKAAVRTAKSTASKAAARKELPFTFPCPTSHEEFVELLEEHDVGPERPEDVEIVVKRIRAVWHPSLGEGNKERMQILMTILTDYIFSVLSPPAPSFTTLSLLLPHLIALQTSYPLLAAQHTISKLVLMQKNLSRGLSRGSSLPDSKTFPGLPELGMLRVIGCVWSTSDYSHPVVAPAMLLMGQYLSQARVRDLKDIGSGLFLSGLVLQYESLSKRYIPEVISFLAQTILLLTPHSFTASTLPGSFPFTDLDTDRVALLKITKSKSISPSSFADLPALLALDGELDLDEAEEAQAKVDLLATAWRLVGKFATLYSSLDGFVEVFRPIEELLKGLNVKKLSPAMQTLHASTLSPISNILKFALLSRRPLLLQSHKPIPIPSYVPKFEGSSYSHTKRYDPDAERNAASKLRSQYKQERKGAIRELRKDARFLAGERNREKDEKDAAYEARQRSIKGAITVERAEEKQMEREKARDKKRAGK